MDNFENWSLHILKAFKKDKNKKIVLIAGASSSGKGYNAVKLSKVLGCHNIKSAIISADSYYKGLAKIITEKTFYKNNLKEHIINLYPKILEIVYKNTADLERPDKFNPVVFNKIREEFSTLMPATDAQKLIKALHKEYLYINFDEPSSIEYNNLSSDLKTLIYEPDKIIYFPEYSFKTCESSFNPNNNLKGSDFDCIIVEGLFVLRPELLNLLNPKNIIKTGVNCDLQTLFARRLNRDVVNSHSRTNTTPEQEIMSFVTQAMPSYFYDIYPTLKEANFVLNIKSNKYTNEKEIAFWQRKYRTTEDIYEKLNQISAKEINSIYQEDFFLENVLNNKIDNTNICLRKQNNELVKLSIKTENKIPYYLAQEIEEFDLATMLKGKTRNTNLLFKMFGNRGFETTIILHKTRKIYEYQDCRFKVDNIENFGTFIEFFPMPIKKLKQLKKLLELDNGENLSYFLLFKDKMKDVAHELKAITFKLENIDFNQIDKEFRYKEVEQFVLNIKLKKLQNEIADLYKSEIDLSIIGSAVIEHIEDEYKLLLLDKTENRIFFKQHIDEKTAKSFIKRFKISKNKTIRYTIIKSLFYAARLDRDENDNCELRIRFDRTLYSVEQAAQLSKRFFNPKVKFIVKTRKKDIDNEKLKNKKEHK